MTNDISVHPGVPNLGCGLAGTVDHHAIISVPCRFVGYSSVVSKALGPRPRPRPRHHGSRPRQLPPRSRPRPRQ